VCFGTGPRASSTTRANPAPEPVPQPEPIVNKYGDTARQAEVRTWLTEELSRINEKKATVTDMMNTGQINYEEYFLLMEECDREKRGLPARARILFLNQP